MQPTQHCHVPGKGAPGAVGLAPRGTSPQPLQRWQHAARTAQPCSVPAVSILELTDSGTPQPPLQAALVCVGGSARADSKCRCNLGHCLGEHLGLRGQPVGSQPLTLTLLFTARGRSPQPQFPVHNPFPRSGHPTLPFSHPMPKQPPPCSLFGRKQVFLRPLLASSLPAPEETTTNPCVFPAQGPSQTQLLSRTHHRQQVLVLLTASSHNTP